MLKRICITLLCLCLLMLNSCSSRQEAAAPESSPSTSGSSSVGTPTPEAVSSSPASDIEPPLSSEKIPQGKDFSWYYTPNKTHQVPHIPQDASDLLSRYQGLYAVPNAGRHIYLTFDEGYELGYSPQILDTLKSNQVKAAFFITAQFLKTQPDLVRRMKNEGHLVCNHTVNHKDLATLPRDSIVREITNLEQSVKEETGVTLDKFLRPPMGNYSELSLAVAHELGYTTVFWSMALVDWDPNNQPGAESVYNHVVSNIHPGAIILLHAVSKSDTEALDRVIKELLSEGYIFSTFQA